MFALPLLFSFAMADEPVETVDPDTPMLVHQAEVEWKTRQPVPKFTAAMRRALSGEVKCDVKVFFSPDGLVESTEITECDTLYADASRTAVMQWVAYPRKVDGVAVRYGTRILVRFKQSGNDAPREPLPPRAYMQRDAGEVAWKKSVPIAVSSPCSVRLRIDARGKVEAVDADACPEASRVEIMQTMTRWKAERFKHDYVWTPFETEIMLGE